MALPSQFPIANDTFRVFADLQVSDMVNANRYRALREKTSLTSGEETELNGLATTLRGKLCLAEDLNLFTDAMTKMQTFIKQTMLDYYKYRGDWSATANPAYTIFNTVRFTDGQVYMAMVTPSATPPTDAGVWLLIGIKGDTGLQGPAGAQLVNRDAYAAGTSYVSNDLVTYNGAVYYAKQNTTGNLPTNTTFWGLFVSGFGENLNALQTVHKTTIVGAVNEVNTIATGAANNVGNTANLATTNKTTIVDAINEVRGVVYTQAQVNSLIAAAKKYQV